MDIPHGHLRSLSLFSGIGGLDQAVGPWARTVAYCEKDRYCQAVLLSRMGRGEIDVAPICEDVRDLSRESFSADIDLLIGGWPCQGNSVAGLRKGMADERSGLITEVTRLVGEIRPTYVFLENVPGVLNAPGDGVGFILQELARFGYDMRWTCLSAAEVGATHRRLRFWLLAHANGDGYGILRKAGPGKNLAEQRQDSAGQSSRMADSPRGGFGKLREPQRCGGEPDMGQPGIAGEDVGDTKRRRCKQRDKNQRGLSKFDQGCSELANTSGQGLQERESLGENSPEERPDLERNGHPPRPPAPNDRTGWQAFLQRFSEAEPALRGDAARIPYRNHRIRSLGNSVDVICAREAFKILAGLA